MQLRDNVLPHGVDVQPYALRLYTLGSTVHDAKTLVIEPFKLTGIMMRCRQTRLCLPS